MLFQEIWVIYEKKKNGHLEPSLKFTEVNENMSISSSMSWIRVKRSCEQKHP